MRALIQLSRRFAVVLGVLFLLPALLAPGSILAVQEDPVVDRARELVEVINDGSTAAIEEFVNSDMTAQMRDAYPMEVHVGALSGMHERGAPYEIVEVHTPDGLSGEILLHSPGGDSWTTLIVRVEAEAPHRVDGVGMRPATAPPPAPAGDAYTDDEIRAAMASTLADLAAAELFSGTVMLARGDEIVFEAVHGEANKDFSVPNRIDTRFNLGSMNKMFTAVAIAQLAERGELSFDDSLAKFLPGFPDPESAEKIQIKHLLSHTSGLGSYFNEEFMQASRARFRTVSDLMTLAEDETLQFEPGTRRSYSNTGFLVLGRVIEVVTGQDYYDYIQANVTGPAGMDATASYQLDHVNPNLAVGYHRPDGPGSPWRNNIFMHVIRGGPAGGGYSTVGDLVRFAGALRDGTLINAETLKTLASPKPELGSSGYGYGFDINLDGSVGHSGGFPGISSHLSFWPAGEWTIAVMSNYSGGAQPVVERARRLIRAGPQAGGESAPAGEAVGRESEIGANMHRYLSAMEALGFSGAIIVTHRGEVVLREGYGLADREARRPYTPATVQTHGSITKQMTGAAILLLESRGELSVDDSIDSYFEDVPEDKRGITIHQLLTHSSGLTGGVGPDDEPIEARAYVERVMGTSLEFEPGTEYAYSNAGYSLLGRIVERVSGQGYEAFLREKLLLPAGLAETGYVLPGWDRDRLAVGYRNGERWGLVHGRGWLDDGPNWHLRANGGLHTTVDDMHRWLNTVRGRGVLDAEAARRWTTGYVNEGSGASRYAYGWAVEDTEWGSMVAHNGSNRIFSADFVWLPELDVFFYLQGNTSMIAAERQRGPLLAAAFDAGFLMPPLVEPDVGARPEEARKRAGTYHLDGGRMELTADDTRLVARVSGQSALDLMLKSTSEQRRQFAELNQRTLHAMDRLKAGQEDALAGMVGENEDPVEPTRALLNRISQISNLFGNLRSLNLIGSFENLPGSGLAEFGPWTTFVHAEFENWNQYWNLVWNSDGTYRGTFSGPWPSFILVPTAEGRYTGVREGPPWDTIELRFEDECLVAAERRACPEPVLEVPALDARDSVLLRESIQTLAERATSAYEDTDPVLYLGNLVRLQLAAGDPAASLSALDSLRSLPNAPGPSEDPGLVALEIHLDAVMGTVEGREGFDAAYGDVFREVMGRLTGIEALDVTWYLETPGFVFENRLQAALDRLEGVRELEVAEAVTLVRTYLSHRIHAEAEPLLTALIAEEENRRYSIQTDVLIATPEGANLSAIVVRDRAVNEVTPTALTFTIYADTVAYRQRAMAAAAHGYVGVAAFSRGKHLSPDEVRPYEHEVDDTDAVLDWISKQPWSDGRVGMYGGSYDGFAAWAATKRLHPALKTIVPWVPAIPGYGLPMENNVFLNANYGWAFFVGNDRYLDYATYNDQERWSSLNEEWYRSGRPYREIDQVDGTPNPHLQRWLRHPAYDEFWQAMVPHGSEYERIDIPILSINGYYDDAQNSAVRHLHEHYEQNPDAEHFLLIGPYDHFGVQARRKPSELRGYTVDPVARFDTQEITFQWLDHVLKGGARPELIRDRINYQVMGANRWEHAPSIGAMGSEILRFYLTDEVSGEHFRLATERPAASGTLEQLVDLADRTTERNSYYPFPIVRQEAAFDSGFSFVSEPFDEPVTVSGSFSGTLRATINKRDLDFHVVLFEIRPDGTLFQLSYHLGRASFAEDMSARRLLTPGVVETLPFARTRLVSRELQEGSRLLVVLDVNMDSFHQVNYGTGRDVSDESIADADEPLQVRWHTDGYVDVPIN